MSRKQPGVRLVVVLLTLALVAIACGKSKKSSGASTTPANVKQGGDLVFAAEQEMDTADWIDTNAGAAWGVYMLETNTMPRAFDFTDQDTYQPGAILDGEPTLTAGPPQKVTYKISSKAVWNDGQPVTSSDFKYTWDQIAHGQNIYDTTGYRDIASVDDSDPKTAVVTFSKVFADWKDLFGGNYGIFPSHILQGKDRDALTKDGYTFSAGPWQLDHWTKGQEVKLVPNPKFWGQKPHLSSITFKIISDTAAEQQAYKSGQVSMTYPQAQPGQEALKTAPDTSFTAISGLSFEGLWFNTTKFPLNDVKVRQALAYATDRDAIVAQLFAPVQPDIKRIDSMATPAFGKFYSTPYSVYSPVDLTKVTSLMTAAGWKKGADGIWAKGGQKANIELKTTTGNKRRELTAQIIQSQWKAAGFNMTLTEEKSTILFGQDGPKGNFQVALYAQTPSSNDPSSCSLWCSEDIPGPSNGNSGTNWTRLADKSIDVAWRAVDTSLDDSVRATQANAGEQAIANLLPALPLDPFPDIVVYNTKLIGGPVTHNFAFGPFTHANLWYLK